MKILAIETSCDETAVSIVEEDATILTNVIHTQLEHVAFGGVVPEVASRQHAVLLPKLILKALNDVKCDQKEITHLAVTYGPGLAGSLMVGVEAAKSLAYLLNIPLIPVNHMAGHVYANLENGPLSFPALAVVVSGGHTEIVELDQSGEFTILSETHDDAVGEVFDKVARVLGLGYPGGPKVSELAQRGENSIPFPKAVVKDDPLGMSFSGLKTAVVNYVHKHNMNGKDYNKQDVAASFETAVVETLIDKISKITRKKNYKMLLLSGGVSANSRLRNEVSKYALMNGLLFSVPSTELCTDNAAMIGLAALAKYKLIGEEAYDLFPKIQPNDNIK